MATALDFAEADLGSPPTRHQALIDWVAEIAAITKPAAIRWCDGSDAEWNELTAMLVDAGTLVALDPAKRPNSFYARSDPQGRRARREPHLHLLRARGGCRRHQQLACARRDARQPGAAVRRLHGRPHAVRRALLHGADRSDKSAIGVELSDSPYVVLSMKIMTRMGKAALDMLGDDGFFVKCVHTVGMPLSPGQADVPWPCADEKWIVHYPETREIWSYGSGYGGNALLGKKCFALRIASVMARDGGWLAEHMLILKLTSPQGKVHYVTAAFPSACGKTNMAMLEPTIPGWTAETVGDDIAWMRFGKDGRLYAVNPEAGFFGVAPGTGIATNKNAVDTLTANCIYTNTALTTDGDVWWEGLTDTPPANLIDWQGQPWDPASGKPAAHPNARFTAPAEQCPSIADEWQDPAGVPISAILFGGRRASAVPLVTEAFDWQHGVYLAANIASEGTAAAEGKIGALRRDPFAMLPFCGYNMADYFAHWLRIGDIAASDARQLPRIYLVNWFRKSAEGKFLWPGYGDNSRVLKWIVERIEGEADATDTPIGRVPTAGSLDLDGITLKPGALDELLTVDPAIWREEARLAADDLKTLGDHVPQRLWQEQAALEERLTA